MTGRHRIRPSPVGVARAAAAGCLCVALATVAAPGAAAQDDPIAVAPVAIATEVAEVPASSPSLDAALERLAGLERRRDAEAAELATTAARLTTTLVDLEAHGSLVERRGEQLDKAEATLSRSEDALAELTVERFVTADGALRGLDPSLTSDRRAELERRQVMGAVAGSQLLAETEHARDRVEGLSAELAELRRRRDGLAGLADELGRRSTELSRSLSELGPRIDEARSAVETARLLATVDGTDMAVVVLDAYWRGAGIAALRSPGCGVDWAVLAGIGRTESRHGTYRGAAPGRDGVVAPPILGPALDGSNPAFALVPDSDGGALDGTAATDRAVGPMQFLPSTWRAVAVDGDGDGVEDPQNIYDAAASAAEYLCRSGPGLEDEGRMRGALFSYNRSGAYVQLVLDRARGYAASVPLARR